MVTGFSVDWKGSHVFLKQERGLARSWTYNLRSNFPSFGWSPLNIYDGGRVRGTWGNLNIKYQREVTWFWSDPNNLSVLFIHCPPSCQLPNSLSNYFKFINIQIQEEYLDDLQDIHSIILILPLLLQHKQQLLYPVWPACLSGIRGGQQHPVHFNKLLMLVILIYYISDKPSPCEASFHIFYHCSIRVLILSIFLLLESSRTSVFTNYSYFNFTHIFELHR